MGCSVCKFGCCVQVPGRAVGKSKGKATKGKAPKRTRKTTKGCSNPSKNRSASTAAVQRRLMRLYECKGDAGIFILLPGPHNAEAHMCTGGLTNAHSRRVVRALKGAIKRKDVNRWLQPLIERLQGMVWLNRRQELVTCANAAVAWGQ